MFTLIDFHLATYYVDCMRTQPSFWSKEMHYRYLTCGDMYTLTCEARECLTSAREDSVLSHMLQVKDREEIIHFYLYVVRTCGNETICKWAGQLMHDFIFSETIVIMHDRHEIAVSGARFFAREYAGMADLLEQEIVKLDNLYQEFVSEHLAGFRLKEHMDALRLRPDITDRFTDEQKMLMDEEPQAFSCDEESGHVDHEEYYDEPAYYYNEPEPAYYEEPESFSYEEPRTFSMSTLAAVFASWLVLSHVHS